MSYRPTSFFLNIGDDAAYKEESFDDSLDADNFNQSPAFIHPGKYPQREASAFISARDNGFSPSDKNRDYMRDGRLRGGNPTAAAARPAASYVLDDEYADDNDQENIMHGNAQFKLPPRLLARLKSQNPNNKVPLVQQEKARQDKTPINVLQNVENVPPSLQCRRDTYIKAPKISKNDVKKALAEANNGSIRAEFNSTIDMTPTHSQANSTASIRAATLHFDEDDVRYINWLNSVILMSFDIENVKVDLGRIVNDVVVPSDVRIAAGGPLEPLKDGVSSLAYKEAKLMNALRVKAQQLYAEQMKSPAELLARDLKVGKYYIRRDKNVMTDVGAKKQILEIFLNYNPLWLKVALECVFKTTIEKMGKRSEVHTLMSVLSTKLLTFKELAQKRGFKNTTTFFMKDDNVVFVKRHILHHFVLLVHFLDIAKRARLIEHDPCLFRIGAECKSTRDILVAFAREYITGVGDITKALRNIGVDLVHIQLPIEQFNFTINKLASDIRDGVRLARLAEIMLKRNDILPKLQFPPDSITRKIHNMELVFKVFEREWLTPLPKGLIARDVANGNRARTIQLLDKLIELYNDRLRLAQLEASIGSVVKIQRWWRAHLACKHEREAYTKLRNAAICVQRHYRLKLQAVAERNEFLKLKSAALVVQRRFRANQLMKLEQSRFQAMRSAALTIQIRFRAYLAMKEAREGFLALRKATILVQQTWRQKKLAQKERQQFLTIRASVLTLQTAARGYLARKCAAELRLRTNAALTIQRQFRANQQMKQQRALFVAKRNAAVTIQQFYRGYRQMVADRASFLKQREAAIVLQKYWRGRVARKSFLELRTSALTIQRQFRANQLMKQEREQYLAKRNATITIQRFYRGYRQMVADRSAFIQQREAAIVLQKYWRGRVARKSFLELRTSTVTIQRHFRLFLETRTQRAAYLELKETTIFVQRTWRLKQLGKADRATFLLQKTSATVIQRAFRAHLERKHFLELRQAAITVQQRFRANREARLQRSCYLEMKSAAIVIQRAWRRHHRLQELTSAALVVQRLYRAKLATRQAVAEFQTKRQAAVTIQQAFRAWALGRKEREEYVRLRNAAILIQRRYREKKRGDKFVAVVMEYCAKVQMSATRIQAWWRAVRVRRAQDKKHAVLPILRQQILDANESATPEKTIGVKMVAILERIKGLRTINLLYKETETIEEFTDVSREICQFIVEHIEVMDSLLFATDQLNRSEPHKKVLSNILGIILNLVTKTDTTILFNRDDIFVMVGKTLRNNANSVQFKNGRANTCPLVTRALQVLLRLLEDGPFLESFKSDTKLFEFTHKLLGDIMKYHKTVPARSGLRVAPPTMPSSTLLLVNTAKALIRLLK